MMKKLSSTTLMYNNSYMVIADAMDILGLRGTYIIYTEGKRQELMKLYLNYKDDFITGGGVYFMTSKGTNFLKRHSEEIDEEEYPGVWGVTKLPSNVSSN